MWTEEDDDRVLQMDGRIGGNGLAVAVAPGSGSRQCFY